MPNQLRQAHDDPLRATGSLRAPQPLAATRRWVNSNAEQALGTLLVVPAITVLPIQQYRVAVMTLGALLVVFGLVVRRATERDGVSPWVTLVGSTGMVGVPSLAPELLIPTLILLTAYMTFVARAYGRTYAIGNLITSAGLLILNTWSNSVVAAPTLSIWIAGTALTTNLVGRTRDQFATLVHDLGVVVWDTAQEGQARRGRIFEDDRHILDYHQAQVDAGRDHELRYRIQDTDGQRWLLELVHVTPSGQSGVLIDITDRMEADDRLLLYSGLVESVGLGMMLVELADLSDDYSLTILAANPAVGAILGLDSNDLPRTRFALSLLQIAESGLIAQIGDVVRDGQTIEYGPCRTRVDGERRYVRLRAFSLPGQLAAVTIEDATASQMAISAVTHETRHDPLTGLPNRSYLNHRLHDALEQADDATSVIVLHADLDEFRDVNEAFGHAFGDRVLHEVARRLRQAFPATHTISRLGGDDFAVVMVGPSSRQQCDDAADMIRHAITEPIELDGLIVQLECAIGIAGLKDEPYDATGLIRRAEEAMYAAKRSALRQAYYEENAVDASRRRLSLLSELSAAVESGELINHYQPIVDLTTGRIVAAETLVRWEHPEHGLLSPAEFIDLAELAGLGPTLAHGVMAQAIADAARWNSNCLKVAVTINLSARSLLHPTLNDFLAEMLEHSGLPPNYLRIEVTEAAVSSDRLTAIATLATMRAAGSQVSIDDFGVGYSSLSLLRHLPLDEVKLDRRMLADLDNNDPTLVRAVIDLAHQLDLRVVAEAVEHPKVLEQLVNLGCDRAQGFLFARPMPVDQFVAHVCAPPAELATRLAWLVQRELTGPRTRAGGNVTNLAEHRARRA